MPSARKRKPASKPIPLAKPPADDSDSGIEEIPRQTLYEQVATHQSTLLPNSVPLNISRVKIPLSKKLSQGELIQNFSVEEYDIPSAPVDEEDDDDEYELGDIGQAFFYTVPLEMLMVAFDCLVYRQYREEILYKDIALRAVKCFLPVWFLIYASHPHREKKLVQAVFFFMSVIAGCYLVFAVNVEGYYATMKRAPSLGTLVIWCVYEMEIIPAVLTCAILGGYTWWNDYGLT